MPENQADSTAAKFRCGLAEIRHRLRRELVEMLPILRLRVSDGYDGVVLACSCLLEIENESVCTCGRLIEDRHARRPVRRIACRRHDIDELCIILDVKGKFSLLVCPGEVCSVGDYHIGEFFLAGEHLP